MKRKETKAYGAELRVCHVDLSLPLCVRTPKGFQGWTAIGPNHCCLSTFLPSSQLDRDTGQGMGLRASLGLWHPPSVEWSLVCDYSVTSYTLEILRRRLPAVCGSETYLVAITKPHPMRKPVQDKLQVTVADQESQAMRAEVLTWYVHIGHGQPTSDKSE